MPAQDSINHIRKSGLGQWLLSGAGVGILWYKNVKNDGIISSDNDIHMLYFVSFHLFKILFIVANIHHVLFFRIPTPKFNLR